MIIFKSDFKNKTRNHCKNRRAIANVVTSAIVISAVSILGVAMLGWSNSNLAIQKQEIEEAFSTQINKINEDLIFDNVWFSSTCPGKCVNVTMSNVGTLGLNVTEMKFVNGTSLVDLQIFYFTDGGIVTGGTFSTNATYSWMSGDDIDIIVYTERGNQFITQTMAP